MLSCFIVLFSTEKMCMDIFEMHISNDERQVVHGTVAFISFDLKGQKGISGSICCLDVGGFGLRQTNFDRFEFLMLKLGSFKSCNFLVAYFKSFL